MIFFEAKARGTGSGSGLDVRAAARSGMRAELERPQLGARVMKKNNTKLQKKTRL